MAYVAHDLADKLATQDLVVLDGGLATELERRGFRLRDHLWSASVLAALKPGGVFVITTCNSTADEVSALFTARGFVEKDRVPYPTFEFGGRKGAAVATVALVARSGGA